MKSIIVRWPLRQYNESKGINSYFEKICPTFISYQVLTRHADETPVRIKIYYEKSQG